MKKNKLILLIIIIGFVCLITGCNSNSEKENKTSQILNCSRKANVTNGEASLTYKIQYKGDNIEVLQSTEKITSKQASILDEYETAYKKIFENYEKLEYYDNEVTRDDNSVTSTTIINYEKIDTTKLLEIEGEEDNIIEDGKAKLSKWKTLAEKFGTTCNE